MEKTGIKEVSELMAAMSLIASKAVKASKDGISLADIGLLFDMDLFMKMKLAVEGVKEVPLEVKDLDVEEVKVLLQMLLDNIKMVVAAAKE